VNANVPAIAASITAERNNPACFNIWFPPAGYEICFSRARLVRPPETRMEFSKIFRFGIPATGTLHPDNFVS
jgi:hypothetical protein